MAGHKKAFFRFSNLSHQFLTIFFLKIVLFIFLLQNFRLLIPDGGRFVLGGKKS
ncbi:MAG: hypothetical protein KatS3mg089_0963 [Patescibacteria group bacterium]|nr:MAG: hypothetical protein KatS3mg089_0963 [Patescibacteria group bacterium]